jgi:hypothetical protein
MTARPVTTAKPAMPQASDHAPLSVLNRTGAGIRTMIVCSCEWMPRKASERGSTMHVAHAAHRRSKGMPPADYAAVIFGEGPWKGLTWDEWYARHGSENVDSYTGKSRG